MPLPKGTLMLLALTMMSSPPRADGGGSILTTHSYTSILGDPGMRGRESSTALSGWNVCDGVQQQAEFTSIPATARLADCCRLC